MTPYTADVGVAYRNTPYTTEKSRSHGGFLRRSQGHRQFSSAVTRSQAVFGRSQIVTPVAALSTAHIGVTTPWSSKHWPRLTAIFGVGGVPASAMVNTCAVPSCSSRSDRETHLPFHALPLSNKALLKRWVHQIGRTNLPINPSTRVCSRHFKNSHGRKLRCDECPTENLPQLATRVSTPTPRSQKVMSHRCENWELVESLLKCPRGESKARHEASS